MANTTEHATENEHYWGIVDMGSNGIRFSITDMTPKSARILPTIWTDRSGISLYDAQYENGQKVPIPVPVIDAVCKTYRRFKRTCQDFGVPDKQVRAIATEATRVALNSKEFLKAIKDATGWDVEMLPKEQEGRVGAYGVASSFESCEGIIMDLGGGSTQITWIIAKNGEVRMSEAGSVSMPYGAAALTRRLNEAVKEGKGAVENLENEIMTNLMAALKEIKLPQELQDKANSEEGLNMYLSGGGFRGWGYLQMAHFEVQPYPVPIINGFRIHADAFHDVKTIIKLAKEEGDVFRVSDRRASQVPAVALLVRCHEKVIKGIKHVFFAQGGVREGALFGTLSREIRSEHPLEVATRRYATVSAVRLGKMLLSAGPPDLKLLKHKGWVHEHLIQAVVQTMYIHNGMNKDIQASAALRCTTTGEFASVLGANHEERAVLALMLCERWGGKGALAPTDHLFQHNIVHLLGHQQAWWAQFFGRAAGVVAGAYPAGIVDDKSLLTMKASWGFKPLNADDSEIVRSDEFTEDVVSVIDEDLPAEDDIVSIEKKGKKKKAKPVFPVLVVDIVCDEDTLATESFNKALNRLEKLSKRKNWPGQEGGYKIVLTVTGRKPET